MRPALRYINEKYDYPLVGVEVGVAAGDNAMEIIENMTIKMLYLVDIWASYFDVYPCDSASQLYGVYEKFNYVDNTKVIHLPSADASKLFKDNSLDFVYIDDNHMSPQVEEGIRNWLPKVKNGGVLCGHDWQIPSVQKVVSQIFEVANTSFGSEDWIVIKDENIKLKEKINV